MKKSEQFDDAITYLLRMVETARLVQGLDASALEAAKAFIVYATNCADWPQRWVDEEGDCE